MKPPKVPSLVSIAILTAITLIFWAFFTAYRVFTTKPPLSVPTELIEPLSPSLDRNTLDKVEGSVFFSP